MIVTTNSPQPTPQIRGVEWIEKLNEIAHRQIIDEVSLRRVELEIEQALSKTKDSFVSAVGYQCLGTIASIRGDRDAVVKRYQQAFSFTLNRGLQINYAVDLRRVNFFKELIKLSQQLFESYPDDINVLRELMKAFYSFGDFISVNKVRQRLFDLKKIDLRGDQMQSEFIERFAKKAELLGVNSQQITDVFETALKVIEDNGFKTGGTGVCLDTEDWSASLRFVVDGTSEQRVMLSSSIAEAIVSKYENDLSELISFGVMAPRVRTDAIESR